MNFVLGLRACVFLALSVHAFSAHANYDEKDEAGKTSAGGSGEKPDQTVEITAPRTAWRNATDDQPSTVFSIPDSPQKSATGGRTRTAEVASDKNDKPTCTNPTASNPVIVSTGEKYEEATDFTAGGLYGLGLARRYHGKGTTNAMFGPKWVGTYDYERLSYSGCVRLIDYPGVCLPQTIKFTDSDGAAYTYTRTGNGTYTIRVP